MILLAAGPSAAVVFAHRFEAPHVVVLTGAMPEAGGWQPASLTADVGEEVRLRLTSSDVMHGFAIGQDSRPPVDVKPGQVTEIALRFDRPGVYVYYCTRWCGPNHWRMRGIIEVSGAAAGSNSTPPAPYLALGIDLDVPHPAGVRPGVRPSATRGESLGIAIPARFAAAEPAHRPSPEVVWQTLRSRSDLRDLTDQQRWDLVASIWRRATNPNARAMGRRLYARNCAACHGQSGRGDGVMVAVLRETLRAPGVPNHPTAQDWHGLGQPADFTHPDLLAASPALLHGKIVRGGMGTGMPSWGPILSDAEVWALVDYLYSVQFTYDSIGASR